MTRFSLFGLVVFSLMISACGASAPAATRGPSQTLPPSTAPPVPSTSPSETACQGIGRLFEALEVGATCWIEIATDDDTPIRVRYTIPAPGWVAFVGTYKDVGAGQDTERVEVARQLATAIWHMLTKRQPFAPAGPAAYLVAATTLS